MTSLRPKTLLLLLPALLCPAAAHAAGTSSAAFLRIGWGARPAAMGEAFTAVADDADALYWNPAGLSYVARLEQTFGHNSWLDGVGMQHASFALRRSTRVVVGAAAAILGTGDIERGNKYGYTEGYYSASDTALIASYSRRLSPKLALGGNLKFIKERVEDASAQAFAMDAGTVYEYSGRIKLGASLKNLGTGMALGETSAPLPLGLRAGAAFQYSKALLLASDLHLPLDDTPSLHFGGEYLYPSAVKGVRLILRAGLKTASMGHLGAMSAVSLGFGAETGTAGLDYALSPYGDLGMTHRISLKLKFDALSAGTGEITVVRDGKEVKKGAAELYAEAMQWFEAKVSEGKMDRAERALILGRIIEKFSALGVDVSLARQKLGGKSAPGP
ncbi:MAG: PorV/PorQ family protein [Elusimicrobiales bacterium]|nr:PorV/PorQ family protein [Elusimicrobiales bacterium]